MPIIQNTRKINPLDINNNIRIGLAFPLNSVNMSTGTTNTRDQIKSNFLNLLLTVPGERINQPNYGVGLKSRLFENTLDESTLLEDINADPSSVYLCSNQQLTNFIPASFNDESYGEDLFKLKVQNEVTFKDDDIPLNTNEDVVLTPADNLDAETNYSELNNLTTNNQTDINALETKYDNAETDTNPVSATQDVSLDFEQDDSVDYDMDLNSSTG